MVEGTKENSHWRGLVNLCKFRGAIYDEIAWSAATTNEAYRDIDASRNGGTTTRFIEYLKGNRIELNTILAAAEPEAFWNWLSYKVKRVWPKRDYRKAIFLDDYMQSPTMNKFVEWYQNLSKPIIAPSLKKAQDELSEVTGLIDDVGEKQEEIEEDILHNALLQDERIKELDKRLEQIMNDSSFNK